MPDLIRKEVEESSNGDRKRVAVGVRNQLIIAWLTFLAWRSENLRKCRIGSRKRGANLFKARVPARLLSKEAEWVKDAVKANPRKEFWQFSFAGTETRSGYPVYSRLPEQLVPLLKEYLEQHRPLLVGARDPGTLFVNDVGRPFDRRGFTDLVGSLTLRYARQRVTPDMFRHAFVMAWLTSYANGYLTLSNAKSGRSKPARRTTGRHAQRTSSRTQNSLARAPQRL